MGSKSNGQVSGYEYYMTLLMGLGRGPIDSLYQIQAANLVAWDGSASYVLETGQQNQGPVEQTTENIPITQPDLFGGDQGQGGLNGYFNLYMGDADQAVPLAVESEMNIGPIPAFRGTCLMMYVGEVTANSPYIQQFKFRCRRARKGWVNDTPWYPENAIIKMQDPGIATYTNANTVDGDSYTTVTYSGGDTTTQVTSNTGDRTFTSYNPLTGESSAVAVPLIYNDISAMNPAHIVYECCTNPDWGRGLDPGLMDDLSFTQSANTLFLEGFGLCLKWSRTDTVDTFVQTVIDHIGAVVYTDKITGLLSMRLIRADYEVGDLPVFDYMHGLLEVTSVDSAAQDSTVNEVIVQYHTPVLDAAAQARAQNIGSINALGAVFSTTKQYPGIPTTDLAIKIAQRDLTALGSGMKRVQMKLDRRAFLMVPGDVFIVNSPDRKLNMIVLRALTVEDSVVSDGTITVTAGQDVFGIPETPFIQAQQSTWLEPNPYPQPIPQNEEMLQECTYRDLCQVLPNQVPLAHGTTYMMVLAQAPTGSSVNFDIWGIETTNSDPGVVNIPFQQVKVGGLFIGAANLKGAIATTDTVITVQPKDRRFQAVTAGMLLYFAGNGPFGTTEYVTCNAVVKNADGTMTLTIGRGCVDTPAVAQADGNLLWAYDQTYAVNTFETQLNSFQIVKLLSRTLRGVLPIAAANQMEGGTSPFWLRVEAPYCGSNFRVNGFPRDQTPQLAGTLTFTWNHRNRLTQADKAIDELQASVSPESGTFYQITLGNSLDPLNGWQSATTTDDTVTFNVSDMPASWASSDHTPANGVYNLTARLYTTRSDAVQWGGEIQSWFTPEIDFQWTPSGTPVTTGPTPTSGWGYNFGRDFGGA